MAGWHGSISLSKISARKQFKGAVNKLFNVFYLFNISYIVSCWTCFSIYS